MTFEGHEVKNLDAVPRFIEPGDPQDEYLDLPIYVTRQVDDATRRSFEACKQRLSNSGPVAAEDTSSNG